MVIALVNSDSLILGKSDRYFGANHTNR